MNSKKQQLIQAMIDELSNEIIEYMVISKAIHNEISYIHSNEKN